MSDGLITVGTYPTAFEANLVKSELEAFGVDAVLEDENIVGLDVLLTNMVGGVKVRVPEAKGEEALRILQEAAATDDDAGDLPSV